MIIDEICDAWLLQGPEKRAEYGIVDNLVRFSWLHLTVPREPHLAGRTHHALSKRHRGADQPEHHPPEYT